MGSWGPGGDDRREKATGSSRGTKAKARVQSGRAAAPRAHTLRAPPGLSKDRHPRCPAGRWSPALTDVRGVWGRGGGGILIHWATPPPRGRWLPRVRGAPGPGPPADLRLTWFSQTSGTTSNLPPDLCYPDRRPRITRGPCILHFFKEKM